MAIVMVVTSSGVLCVIWLEPRKHPIQKWLNIQKGGLLAYMTDSSCTLTTGFIPKNSRPTCRASKYTLVLLFFLNLHHRYQWGRVVLLWTTITRLDSDCHVRKIDNYLIPSHCFSVVQKDINYSVTADYRKLDIQFDPFREIPFIYNAFPNIKQDRCE